MSKDRTKSVALTQEQIRSALRNGEIDTLTPEEEKVVRMRLGATLSENAPLARADQGNVEVAERLAQMEAELIRRMREVEDVEEDDVSPRPVDSRVKSKIVRALRRKD